MQRVLALILLLLAAACGPRRPPATPGVSFVVPGVATPLPAGACRFAGRWTAGGLHTTQGGIEFVSVSDGHVLASIDSGGTGEATGAPPRLFARLSWGGWHLEGRVDLARSDVLRARRRLWLSDAVTVSAGAEVQVLGARPGEVRVAPPRFAFPRGDGFTFVAPVERWAPCADFGFFFRLRDEETDRRERLELGLPADPPLRHIGEKTTATLSLVPGGPPFLRIGPREYSVEARVLEEGTGAARVALQSWTGTTILGWLPASALGPRDEGGFGGILGGMAGPEQRTICVSAEALTLWAVKAGAPPERIGWVDAGTRFSLGERAPDGSFALRPHPAARVDPAQQVTWRAQGLLPLRCAPETYDPLRPLGRTPDRGRP